MEKLYDSWN